MNLHRVVLPDETLVITEPVDLGEIPAYSVSRMLTDHPQYSRIRPGAGQPSERFMFHYQHADPYKIIPNSRLLPESLLAD